MLIEKICWMPIRQPGEPSTFAVRRIVLVGKLFETPSGGRV
jgi:hypothetical protein